MTALGMRALASNRFQRIKVILLRSYYSAPRAQQTHTYYESITQQQLLTWALPPCWRTWRNDSALMWPQGALLGSQRRSLQGHTVTCLFHLLPSLAGTSTLYPHSCFQHSECCFSIQAAWQGGKASEGISALGSDLRGSDKCHQTAQECWHTSKSNSTGATSCGRNNSHSSYVKIPTMIRSACPALIQDGWLCLKATQQTLPCLRKTNGAMAPSLNLQGWQLSKVPGWQLSKVPDWLLEALETWHGPTAVSSSRATKLLHTHPAGRPMAGAGGGGSSAPSMIDVQAQHLLHQRTYNCVHSTGHLNISLLMINSAKKRILKQIIIHFF